MKGWETTEKGDKRRAIFDSIIEGHVHELGRIGGLFVPDLIRVSPELRRELLLSINDKTGMSDVRLDMEGNCFIYGMQIEMEPLFSGLTFRIESGRRY